VFGLAVGRAWAGGRGLAGVFVCVCCVLCVCLCVCVSASVCGCVCLCPCLVRVCLLVRICCARTAKTVMDGLHGPCARKHPACRG
jgi:hypothetical protein